MIKGTGLSKDVLAMLIGTFKKYAGIDQVTLYGSRAKGTFNERSDIDLVAYGKDLDRFVVSQVLLDLDDSDIPFMVDFQDFSELKNRRIIEHIERVGQIIYNSEQGLDKSAE